MVDSLLDLPILFLQLLGVPNGIFGIIYEANTREEVCLVRILPPDSFDFR